MAGSGTRQHAASCARGCRSAWSGARETGDVLLDPDEAVRGAIPTILDRFAELGSAHQVWRWLREQKIEQFPLQALHQARDPVGDT